MIKSLLSKIKFELSLNPKIISTIDYRLFIPLNYKAVCLLQADFELAWAWRFSKSLGNPIEQANEIGLRERSNIPRIIELSEYFNIPITWATVGHLFLKSCTKSANGRPHPEIQRLSHFKNKYWDFSKNDWFESDPCSDYKKSPSWYSPDLIHRILESNVEQEIGCHTFSHIDCRDEICSPEVFDSEINACKRAASGYNIKLKTFVHPAHTIGNIERLALHGFSSYRTDYENVLGYPVKHDSGIWEIKNTAALYYRNKWSLDYHIYRYKKIIDRAIRTNTVCCLWFHPSLEKEYIDIVFASLFKYLDNNRKEILISTTSNYIDSLNRRLSFLNHSFHSETKSTK